MFAPKTYKCLGDPSGNRCNMLISLQPGIIIPIGKYAKVLVQKYLDGDGKSLSGTDFYHLHNYEAGGFKNEFPRVGLALTYAKGWNVKRLQKEGLKEYLKDVIS
jgi:hypothetical protein